MELYDYVLFRSKFRRTFIYCKKSFSLKTSILLSLQTFNIIKSVHESGFVHRDVKPDNFVIGFGNSHNRNILIDFGLSVSFINKDTMQHKDYIHKHQFTGSFRYSSINNHKRNTTVSTR